jgi:glycosyltransferase involved in cell wall biosynthesis
MSPPIAVVIPTRNRGAQAAQAALAVLRDQADLELVVVDQSDDHESTLALEAIGDSRLRVVRSASRGASNARNVGVAATTAPIIAFTDDDCRPEPTWATTLLRLFDEDPQTGLIFGRVRLPEQESSTAFGASFEPQQRVQQGAVPLPDQDLGIGASFAIRRGTLAALGGFDPYLGPGAPLFFAAEETDLIVRALHAGHKIINTTECEVLHLGVREGAEVRRLIVGYRLSVGAAFAKHARLSGWSGFRDGARWAGFFVRETLRELAALTRPHPGSVVYFLAGAAMSLRYGVDKNARVFCRR